MADLEIPEGGKVAVVVWERQKTLPAGAAIEAGQIVYPDTDGLLQLYADEDGFGGKGIATRTVAAGEACTILQKGKIYLGGAEDGLDIGAEVFASANAGNIDDTAGTDVIGVIEPHMGQNPPQKIVAVDLN